MGMSADATLKLAIKTYGLAHRPFWGQRKKTEITVTHRSVRDACHLEKTKLSTNLRCPKNRPDGPKASGIDRPASESRVALITQLQSLSFNARRK